MQHRQATQQHNAAHAPTPAPAPLHRQQQTPIFQKIELQIPNKPTPHISPNILPNTVPKINLAIGKPANSTFVYTDLPPELQNFTPPVYNISSATEAPMTLETLPQLPQLDVYNKPIGAIDSREMSKIDYNNSELLDIATSMETSMENNKDLMNEKYIKSLLENDLPYHLLNKLEESNIVIGQQQLEAYDLIINIFKNKNREEKIENIKRSHIQKCVQWCEKNQLPHNKFIDKVNIFLSPKKKQEEDEECV
jgi:hypothetical protein